MANESIPGMNYPTQKAMLAGNPRDSAIQASVNMNAKQASLGAIGGRRMRRTKSTKKRGGADAIPVPQYQMLYTPQGGNSTNPNAQIQQNSVISTQGAANSVYDKDVFKGGMRRRYYKKGGNPNWNWGCYSGGKRKTMKTRKSRKTRKTRKSRKSRKY